MYPQSQFLLTTKPMPKRLALLLLLSVACARPFTPATAPSSRAETKLATLRARARIVPRVDHHQHILGPTAMPSAPARLPTILVPQEIDRLLAERGRIYANAKSSADLDGIFSKNAQALSWRRPSMWVRGDSGLMTVLNAVMQQTYRYEPNALLLGDSVGWVAGVVSVIPKTGKPVAALDFLLGLQKRDGAWRISAEATTVKTAPLYAAPITADKVVSDLDDAGIERAIILTAAFWIGTRFSDPADEMTKEYDAVRAENDWAAEQVARHPDRLVMACSVNVLRAYAVRELERCAKLPQVKAFKLHFGDADVDLNNASHLAKVRLFFKAANDHRLPIIVHLAPRRPYGAKEVEIFLSQVMSEAPDIPVQIAHLGGDGPRLDSPDATMAFARARAAKDPRTRNLYFDFAGLGGKNMDAKEAQLMAQRMREIGLDHVFYGSDGQPPNGPVAEHWLYMRSRLPLTNDELTILANNVAPSMR
jgi:predicted TIM-barrel fold metal-dependent hydrolase